MRLVNGVLPRLVVFDLDACCWYPEMYMMSSGSPFSATEDPSVMTSCRGERVRLLGAVREIWQELDKEEEVGIAVASRCDVPAWARELLRSYKLEEGKTMWEAASEGELVEIYKGSKKKHFRALHEKTRIPYEQMLFFDDDPYNIREVGALGVVCVLTPDGVTRDAYRKGLELFAAR